MKADNFSEILQLILKRVKDCVKISAFCWIFQHRF